MPANRNAIECQAVLNLPLWRLDGTGGIRDGSAYGHPGAVTGAVWTPRGRVFDGVDDRITIGDIKAADFNQSDFTIAVWANSSQLTGSVPYTYISKWVATGRQYALQVRGAGMSNPLKVVFEAGNGSNDDGVIGTAQLTTGRWYFIVGCYRDTVSPDMRVYIDGREDNAATGLSQRVGDTASSLVIGARADAVPNYFKGTISEVVIFNRLLSPLEVMRLFLATKWRYQ